MTYRIQSSLAIIATLLSQTLHAETLGDITVTGTREAVERAETTTSTTLVDEQTIEEVRPAHPAELMNRMPGVHVNALTGEGHMTAIRQPITTAPVYLFLEDGIPTRSTGFFNHNALYEVNVPQAGAVEVLRGPGTALYGSDAIGGVINVMTRPAPTQGEFGINAEGGSYGWGRLLLSGGNAWGDNGLRADLNLTHDGGYRDDTEYDRQSATLRWDRDIDETATLATVLTGSNIDQPQTGSISRDDFENDPTVNYTPIGYREVQALRLSSAYERETARSLLSITPYLRHNTLDLMPTWQLSYDPQIWEIDHRSIGAQIKYRRDYTPARSRLILGADLDHSPGSHLEQEIIPVKDGRIYTDYSLGEVQYDYDVTFSGISPYIHYEASPITNLRLSAGLRYDALSYDYENHLSVVDTGRHRRPESTRVDFSHLSPKFGLVYAFTERFNGFFSYRHAFRAPSEGQLFRQGQAESTVDLDPVKADSLELGLRGKTASLNYELSVYHMTKKDDIISFQNTLDGTRETLNAGETLHRGVEAALGAALIERLHFDLAVSFAKHTYEDWQPKTGIDYSGQEIKNAPRLIANTRLAYRPKVFKGGRIELEWEKLGPYWMDDENTHEYEGHDLLHLRANYPATKNLNIQARLMNLTDERYAVSARYSQFRGEELTPGKPRSAYLGLDYQFK